ncbi:MAG: hypothetical protein AABW73_04375 [Nanoarchaeota archaeon]
MEEQSANNKTQKHSETVNKIIILLQERGPTLPIHISSQTGLSMIFASAFLSELIGKKLVKTSNMRIGSSPLYYLPGQELQLLNFVEHIKGRERDALELIKKEEIIRDEYLEPAIRVAMRSIKDFANPIQANLEGKSTIFWRFFKIPDMEAKERIKEMLEPKKKDDLKVTSETKKEKVIEEITENKKPAKKDSLKVMGEKTLLEEKAEKKETNDSEILEIIKKQLINDGLEIKEEIEVKKREGMIKASAETKMGKMEILVVFKDKKKISEIDLAMALQRAQNEKIACLFLSEGTLNKKGIEYLDTWKNLLFFKRISFK